MLDEELLFQVARPGQYLGNEWGAARKPFDSCDVRLCLAFPDLYELGMSNFGQRILYQLVNDRAGFMCDRTYAPDSDMETLLRDRELSLWGWESRALLNEFELVGFSLQYELTYTNVLNMLDLSNIPIHSRERESLFPLVFGGGPSSVNPEPMANFFDFYIIGDGEEAVPEVMETIRRFKLEHLARVTANESAPDLRVELLTELAKISGVYVPCFYEQNGNEYPVKPVKDGLPARVLRQIQPLTDSNQPTRSLVSYLNLIFDRQTLEVRRGCDRGCRFCQPGYTFLPVRERATSDLVRLSKEAIKNSGHEEYSMLSLCVSDYTSLHESVRELNREHAAQRTSMSFPSQRADRMNLEIAEELKAVRKSGITLAPEAGTERLRAVINKGLSHEQIISAIKAAYQSGWSSVKLYYMIGLPTETDEDLQGIIDTLVEATACCREIRKNAEPGAYKRDIDFTCTISNFVPKPFTPFQWFAQVLPAEFARKHQFLRERMRAARIRNVQLNCTDPETSLLESVISRGDRVVCELIETAWRKGCRFDAWSDRFKPQKWYEAAADLNLNLEEMSCLDRPVGSRQPWDVVHVGLMDWWLAKEWEKAIAVKETAPCTENTCHACGICTELDTVHVLANPKPEVMKKNPFVKELAVTIDDSDDVHPSLFFEKPPEPPANLTKQRLRTEFVKSGALKFIGHLDLHHLFIKAARRAGMPLAWTEGFNPSAKISIALSLSLFYESDGEVADFELVEEVSPEDFVTRMNAQLPPELTFRRARSVEKVGPSVSSLVGRADYQVVLVKAPEALTEEVVRKCIDDILASNSVVIEREPPAKHKKGKRESSGPSQKEIRPYVFSLELVKSEPITLKFSIAHGPVVHVKPTDILKLVVPGAEWRITRSRLLSADGTPLFEF